MLWLLAAGLAQATVVHFLAPRGAVPSLILIVVALFASRSSARGAILFGAAAGVLDDALAGNTGAAWTIATTVAALAMCGSARVLFVDSTAVFAAMVFAAALLRDGIFWSVMSLQGYPPGLGVHDTKLALASAAYTAAVALLVRVVRARRQGHP